MYTYQDLLQVGNNEKDRMEFIQNAVSEYKSSPEYKFSVSANMYYLGENPSIMNYEKYIYDMQGRAHQDMYTANHKIASSFFGKVVNQEVMYLLGNGVVFKDKTTADRLGTKMYSLDQQVTYAVLNAAIGGTSFGFWNLNHIDVFSDIEFMPLYDEEDGALKSGIRFWQMTKDKPERFTLYESDGYTSYIKRDGEDITVLRNKITYKRIQSYSKIDGFEIYNGGNYPTFPIVPMRYSKNGKSELWGKRNLIDSYDLATSQMVNNVSEGSLIYWVLQNCGGMDEIDDKQFLDAVKRLHVVHPPADATAEPRTIEAPFAGTEATIDMLTKRLYSEFNAFDNTAITAGNQTATAIKASYVPLDLKCDLLEVQVTKFINGILELAGIDDKPTYNRNPVINKQEEVQTILLMADRFPAEYIDKKLLAILGDIDRYDDIMADKDKEDMSRIELVETEDKIADTSQ